MGEVEASHKEHCSSSTNKGSEIAGESELLRLPALRVEWVEQVNAMRKKPPHRAMYLEDALHAIADMERTFAELESCEVFQAFTPTEKARYHDVLGRLRDLIRDLEQDTAQEQMVS
jgi:hypothetical protein